MAWPYIVPTEQLFRLEKRTIAITGACGGLGLAVTEAVIESGADVLCLDLPSAFASDGWRWLLSVARKHGCIAKSYPIDVTKAEDVFKTFDLSTKCVRYPLRGLVTCAGISGEAPAIEYPEAVVRKIFDVNYFGSLFCAQAAARCFQANNVPGSIVFIASMSGSIANKGLPTAAYNSSKAAVLQLTKSLAAEWGNTPDSPPVRVNSLSPGHVRTAITADALARGWGRAWAEGNMLGRISETYEYRAPVLFLLGDGSSFMTGADLKVDGGHTAWAGSAKAESSPVMDNGHHPVLWKQM